MTAIDTMNRFFTWAEIISSTYWNIIYGTKAEEWLEDSEFLRTMPTLEKIWHGF